MSLATSSAAGDGVEGDVVLEGSDDGVLCGIPGREAATELLAKLVEAG